MSRRLVAAAIAVGMSSLVAAPAVSADQLSTRVGKELRQMGFAVPAGLAPSQIAQLQLILDDPSEGATRHQAVARLLAQ